MKQVICKILVLVLFSFQLSAKNGCFTEDKNDSYFVLDLKTKVSQSIKGCNPGSYTVDIINLDANSSYLISTKKSYLSNTPLSKVDEVVTPFKQKSSSSIFGNLLNTFISNELFNSKKSYKLDFNQKLRIEVEKIEADPSENQKWFLEINTRAKGKWIASWSIAILPNRNENYFTKKNNDNQFIITKKRDNKDWSLVPAVFYTYAINVKKHSSIQWGPTLGLGLDKSELTPFIGVNMTFNDNIGISIGGVINKREKLLGEYNDGDIVNENISTLTEKVYKPNYFIALSYKF